MFFIIQIIKFYFRTDLDDETGAMTTGAQARAAAAANLDDWDAVATHTISITLKFPNDKKLTTDEGYQGLIRKIII